MCWRTGPVPQVHEHAGIVRLPLELDLVARRDRLVVDVPGRLCRVEVNRVPHVRRVAQRKVDVIALAQMHHLAWHYTVERPGVHLDASCHLDRRLLSIDHKRLVRVRIDGRELRVVHGGELAARLWAVGAGRKRHAVVARARSRGSGSAPPAALSEGRAADRRRRPARRRQACPPRPARLWGRGTGAGQRLFAADRCSTYVSSLRIQLILAPDSGWRR
jgi:hypothetical protein